MAVTQLADPAGRLPDRRGGAGRHVMEAVRRAPRDHLGPCAAQGVGAMFQIALSADGAPTRLYGHLFAADPDHYEPFRHELPVRGIHVNAYSLACRFTSSALDADDIRRIREAVNEAFAAP
ncbi:hypothetical protein ACFVY0_12390 [Streptomyces sp. NPDC058286]|uniref:hypothetical protein n=1 Tax=unclassified Streptomyces TaxID=2593676 RepID=UPI0036E375DB